MYNKFLAAAALSAVALVAQAGVTAGVANQDTTTFLDLATDATVVGPTYTGNALPTAAIPMDTGMGYTTSGEWLAGTSAMDATITFAAPTSFVSFLWGSPDTYNELDVWLVGMASPVIFTSADFPTIVFDGNQDFASYIGLTATGGDMISSLTFKSTSNSFEASNFSLTTPVPEPETYALMLAGLAAVGFVARRRKNA